MLLTMKIEMLPIDKLYNQIGVAGRSDAAVE